MSTTILLRPRPYAKYAGFLLLVPLLPKRKPLKPLPAEIWSEIFSHVLGTEREGRDMLWLLTRVCKSFYDIALPLLYASVYFSKIATFEKFYRRLYAADQKWDSIRRIPYSSPGRWVHAMDLSQLAFEGQALAVKFDNILTQLFPLIPFLSALSVNPSFVLSRRALYSLAQREGAINIRSLIGLSYVPSSTAVDEDPFVLLLRSCPNVEELAVVGQGLDPAELAFNFSGIDLPSMIAFRLMFEPLHLPKLRFLSLLSMHSSPLMQAFLKSPLPALKKLEITPYDDIPYPASLSTEFIITHGKSLRSLLLFTPKSWPTRLRPSSERLLAYCPDLNHLSCELPLPNLNLVNEHNLRILSIPKPSDEFWRVLEDSFPLLPNLLVLRTRDVKWVRKGICSVAREAGIQGKMREWKHRLERRRIRLLDADWKEME